MNIIKLLLDSGACDAGACRFESLLPFMDEKKQRQAYSLCPGAKTVLIGAYPYYVNREPGNLALYARGEDYHQVLVRRLRPVCEALFRDYPTKSFVPLVDASPLPEKVAAMRAGLGCVGLNSLFISDSGGSFVFLACILTSLEIETQEQELKGCCGCGACLAACPTGAIAPGRPIDAQRCLSAITQRKELLEPWETEALESAPAAWGCDICQLVCPANADLKETSIQEFKGGTAPYLRDLDSADLEGLSNREFKARYGDRAFSYRGRSVLLRDLQINQKKK